MPLYRNRVNHISAIGGVQRIGDAFGQHIVFRPVLRCLFDILHILHAGKGIKTHIGKDAVAVVEHRPMVVDRM